MLIEKGADVNMTDSDNSTAIILAAQKGKKISPILQWDFSKQKTISIHCHRTRKYRKFAYWKWCWPQRCQQRKKVRPDISSPRRYDLKECLIFIAKIYKDVVCLWSGFEKIAELLIRNGANANLASDNGDTPLIIAANKGM